MTTDDARQIVKANYPNAVEVATGSQIWIQSAPDGVTISKAIAFRTNFNAQHKAWVSAAENAKKRTADEAYREARAKVGTLLEEFNAKLAGHAAKQIQDSKNWGFAGDMNHYAELLEELLGKRG